jgi:hypothetical protein
MRRIIGNQTEKIRNQWRILHLKKLYYLYSSSILYDIFKENGMGGT